MVKKILEYFKYCKNKRFDEAEPHTRLFIYELGSVYFYQKLWNYIFNMHMSIIFYQIIYYVYKFHFFLCKCHKIW